MSERDTPSRPSTAPQARWPRRAQRGETLTLPAALRGMGRRRGIDRSGIRAKGRDWMILVWHGRVRFARGPICEV